MERGRKVQMNAAAGLLLFGLGSGLLFAQPANTPSTSPDGRAVVQRKTTRDVPRHSGAQAASAPKASTSDAAATSAGSRGSGGSDGLPGTGAAAGSGGSADMRGEPVRR